MSDETKKTLSRRAALARLGVFATAGFAVPALTTVSMAHASSGSSNSSDASESSDASDASDASSASDSSSSSSASESSGASFPSFPSNAGMSNEQKLEYKRCKDDSSTLEEFTQCLIDAGLDPVLFGLG